MRIKPSECYPQLPQPIESDDYAAIVDNHVTNASRMDVRWFGLVVTSPQIAAMLPKGFDKVKCWGNGKSPATQRKVIEAINRLGLIFETRFDAVHGRRYVLCVYALGETPEQYRLIRNATLAKA